VQQKKGSTEMNRAGGRSSTEGHRKKECADQILGSNTDGSYSVFGRDGRERAHGQGKQTKLPRVQDLRSAGASLKLE
jgi:hypothetical protein